MRTVRLGQEDVALARTTFAMMDAVFETGGERLGDTYLRRLLGREDFWALAAVVDGVPVGGVTAHVLPMTRAESSELLVYDVAVRADWRRRGVGRALLRHLLRAGTAPGRRVDAVFVLADDEDAHALDFYRALGGVPEPVTSFTLPPGE
jgi:aminoglycoside 3-N-acetyltransferase I